MSTNIRFPNITEGTPSEQISQIKSYLHQLVQQLNWALQTIEAGTTTDEGEQPTTSAITEESFNELKSLIAQSTAMLDTYYEKINNRLDGQYVSQAEFDAHEHPVDEWLTQLAGPFVSKTDFDAYKQEVSDGLSGLDDKYVLQTEASNHTHDLSGLDAKYVSKEDFEIYKQETNEGFTGLDEKYASKLSYDTFMTEYEETILSLQTSIAELKDAINTMQEAGGEQDGSQQEEN